MYVYIDLYTKINAGGLTGETKGNTFSLLFLEIV